MGVCPAGAEGFRAERTTLVDSALPDLPAWWGEPGRPGWTPGADLGTCFPWALAGHVIGAWGTSEPERAPQGMPFPGVLGMQTPLTWFDTLTVAEDREASWDGFRAALARVRAQSLPLPRRAKGPLRAQADAMVGSG